MKVDELIKEFMYDFEQIINIKRVKQEKADKIIKRSSMFPVYIHSNIKTKRGNEWIILMEAKSKKDIGNKCLASYVSLVNSDEGRYAITSVVSLGKLQFIIFTPHFFQRFSLRTGINLTGTELIHRYFKLNSSFGYTYGKEVIDGEEKIHIFGSTKEGIAMGTRLQSEHDVILFRTFITYDMCKGQQIENFAKAEEIRKEANPNNLSEWICSMIKRTAK